MTDRDRLIEIFKKTEYTPFPEMTMTANLGNQFTDYGLNCIVDEILSNGVIFPPCKVGDKVYYPYDYGNKVLEKTVKRIVIENNDKWLDVGVSFLPFENIGKTVFLTKEEAEQKLKESEGQ